MLHFPRIPEKYKPSKPFAGLLVHIGGVIAGLGIFQFIALLPALFMLPSVADLLAVSEGNYRNVDPHAARVVLLTLLGLGSFGGFILMPLVVNRLYDKLPARAFSPELRFPGLVIPATIFALLFFLPFDGFIVEWNRNLAFPEFMRGFADWAREAEDKATKMTEMITGLDSLPELALGMLVVAVIPAIGEELFFRGVLQTRLRLLTGNVHAGIWLSAFLFSAIHMQFFGFVPRMLLGLMFGYIYAGSGNLVLPMIAHFVNNGLTLLSMYLYKHKLISLDPDSADIAPWYMAVVSGTVAAALIYYVANTYSKLPKNDFRTFTDHKLSFGEHEAD
ncbi:MAG: CPBP family intramembrane glutamic endopeptidase [Bacteroidota bacterium]